MVESRAVAVEGRWRIVGQVKQADEIAGLNIGGVRFWSMCDMVVVLWVGGECWRGEQRMAFGPCFLRQKRPPQHHPACVGPLPASAELHLAGGVQLSIWVQAFGFSIPQTFLQASLKQGKSDLGLQSIMSEGVKKGKKEKKSKVEKGAKDSAKKEKSKKEKKQKAAATAFSLLADDKAVDPTLSSLFAAKVRPCMHAQALCYRC